MATVTSKGQVTIPKKVREALDLRPGSEVDFVLEDGKVVLRRRGSLEVFEKWRGRGLNFPEGVKTVDEFMELLRGRPWPAEG